MANYIREPFKLLELQLVLSLQASLMLSCVC